MSTKALIGGVLAILILVGLGVYFSRYQNEGGEGNQTLVSNFEDCVNAGYKVMDSYPRRCRTSDGKTFIEDTSGDPADKAARESGGCYIGGCSSQICSEEKDAISTCEYKDEYACYNSARCERQTGGECGWTQTPQLTSCLQTSLDVDYDLVK